MTPGQSAARWPTPGRSVVGPGEEMDGHAQTLSVIMEAPYLEMKPTQMHIDKRPVSGRRERPALRLHIEVAINATPAALRRPPTALPRLLPIFVLSSSPV